MFKKLLTKFATKQRCWKVQQGNKSGASDSGGWRVAAVKALKCNYCEKASTYVICI